ncbi:MAG: hypothetical protein LBU97_06110 [Alistipes sp.]|jgi:hypothetical protein|nr:hypothetical protein [Alistipes sp.]
MKNLLLSTLALITVWAAGAQNAPRQNDPNQMSIRIAGYEVLLNGQQGEQNEQPEYEEHEKPERESDIFDDDGLLVVAGEEFVARWENRYNNYSNCDNNRYRGHIGLVELGFGGLRATPSAYSAYPTAEAGFMDVNMSRSIHIALNLFTFSTRITRSNALGLSAGVGMAASNFRTLNTTAFHKEGGMIRPSATEQPLKKSKLSTFAIHLPVALEINPSSKFFFSVGGYADLTLGSHMKWKAPKDKLKGAYTNFVQAGLTARVGLRDAYAFANYGLTDVFRRGHGPVVSPYTFGIGFGF